jgi:transcriptional regulator with XRE-family HTH domain
MGDPSAMPDVLAELGPRLRRLRERRGITLTALAAKTGIFKSTLSRLETGQRKPSLELLLPLAETYHLPLDELVGAPPVGDPRVRTRGRTRNGRLVFPLTQHSSGMAVWKVVIPSERERKLRTHAGYEWLYVLSGEMRLILGEHDITMRPGEAAESTPSCRHWFGPASDEPVEDPQRPRQPCSADARPRSAAPHAPAGLSIPVRRTANHREARLPKRQQSLASSLCSGTLGPG